MESNVAKINFRTTMLLFPRRSHSTNLVLSFSFLEANKSNANGLGKGPNRVPFLTFNEVVFLQD